MSVRSSALERIQVGVESVAGTGVSANKRLMGLDRLTLKPMLSKSFHRSAGSQVPTSESRAKEWSTFDFEGPACYLTMAYLLSALLKNEASSPYTYTPDPYGVNTIKTLTIETGSGIRAEKVAYGVVSSLRFRSTQADVSVNGSGFARAIQQNQTLTAGATEIGPVPIDPYKGQVLIGSSLGGIQLAKHLEYELDIPELWKPHAPLDASTDSFTEHKAVAGEPSLSLALEYQSDAETLLTAARNKTPIYVQYQAAASPYDLTITTCCMVEAPDRADKDDVFAGTFKLRPKPTSDIGSGSWLSIVLTNGLTL